MITTNNTFSGATYTHSGENCTATGEWRRENNVITSISISGTYNGEGRTVPFYASRDANGSVNISGVPAAFIVSVATEVATIISEIENPSAQDANEE